MNEKQKEILEHLIEICNYNSKEFDSFEAMLWDNMKNKLTQIKDEEEIK